MKKILMMAVAVMMITQVPVLYAGDKNNPGKYGMSTDIGKNDMGMMKQNMNKMMEQMKEIHATKDPVTRMKLRQEHMKNMHKGMDMMRGMGGGMMMGMMNDENGGGEMMSERMDKKMSVNDMGQRHNMMEQRMDMMQMMMEQMMGQMEMQENIDPMMKDRLKKY